MSRPLDALTGYQLRRASVRAMTSLSEALAPLGLSVTQVSVLYQVAGHAGNTSSEVGRALGIKRANMAPLVAGLVSRHYLSTAPRDGRSQGLYLTDAGAAVFASAQEVVEAEESRLCAPLSEAEQGTLRRLLVRLRET